MHLTSQAVGEKFKCFWKGLMLMLEPRLIRRQSTCLSFTRNFIFPPLKVLLAWIRGFGKIRLDVEVLYNPLGKTAVKQLETSIHCTDQPHSARAVGQESPGALGSRLCVVRCKHVSAWKGSMGMWQSLRQGDGERWRWLGCADGWE